jgi:hypothetical protein
LNRIDGWGAFYPGLLWLGFEDDGTNVFEVLAFERDGGVVPSIQTLSAANSACMVVYVAGCTKTGVGTSSKYTNCSAYYRGTSGTAVLSGGGTQDAGTFSASLTNVNLQEFNLDGGSLIPGGRCFDLTAYNLSVSWP